jgi:uncharacterized protein (TIGR02118 family)
VLREGDVFKAMVLLTRSEELSRDAFGRWWLEEHRPLAARLPGLRRYVVNLVQDGPEDGFDGVAELWFDSREAFEAAYETEAGKLVVADSMAHARSRVRYAVEEHE